MTGRAHLVPPLGRYLAAIHGGAPAGSLVEVRFRVPTGMGRTFHSAGDLASVAAAVHRHAPRTDVYVGVLPRRDRHGGLDALMPEAAVLWVDCDTPESTAALRAFAPQPSLVVSSGTRRNCHAYWLLGDVVGIDVLAAANRRLATALGADSSSGDPARILRPPFPALNHKHDPPAAACLVRCEPTDRHRLGDILATVADPDGTSNVERPRPGVERATTDPLLTVSPRVYVERLLGQTIRRDGKVTCPFHPDDTPSLHVYAEPERGWYCYGCRQGGSVYDLAARLWHRETRGADFIELRNQLAEAMGHGGEKE